MNQSKLEVITCSWRKARQAMTQLVLVLLLIGWKSGANLLSQSRSVKTKRKRKTNYFSTLKWKPLYNTQTCFGCVQTVHPTQELGGCLSGVFLIVVKPNTRVMTLAKFGQSQRTQALEWTGKTKLEVYSCFKKGCRNKASTEVHAGNPKPAGNPKDITR